MASSSSSNPNLGFDPIPRHSSEWVDGFRFNGKVRSGKIRKALFDRRSPFINEDMEPEDVMKARLVVFLRFLAYFKDFRDMPCLYAEIGHALGWDETIVNVLEKYLSGARFAYLQHCNGEDDADMSPSAKVLCDLIDEYRAACE